MRGKISRGFHCCLPATFCLIITRGAASHARADGLIVNYTDLDFFFIRFHLIQATEAIS